eukprot:UN26526
MILVLVLRFREKGPNEGIQIIINLSFSVKVLVFYHLEHPIKNSGYDSYYASFLIQLKCYFYAALRSQGAH